MGLFSKRSSAATPPAPPQEEEPPPPYTPTPQQQQSVPSASPPEPRNPDTRPLEYGWITQFDPASQKWFYVYTPTAHRQWEHPADRPLYAPPPPPRNPDTRPLEKGWITQFDPASQRWFYVYTPTAHRQWEHPADRPLYAPPPGPYQGSYYGGPGLYPYPQQQPYYPQQVSVANQRRGGGSGVGSMAGAAAFGLGAGVLGLLAADVIADDIFDGFGGF